MNGEKENEGRGQGKAVRAGAMIALGAAMLAITPATIAQQQDDGATMNADQLAAAVDALATQIRTEISRLVPTASVEEFEASILFAVDQSAAPVPVVCSAVDKLKADSTIPNNAKSAMDNVCRNIRNQRGTGAIANGGSNFGTSAFSSPVVSLGGGSGYTQ